jgi:hypothetical protein
MMAGPAIRSAICSALAATSFHSAPALADVPEEPIRLSYRAPPECLDQQGLEADVRRRARAARFVDDDSSTRRFVIEIERIGARFVGRVRVTPQEGAEGERRFEDADCGEVARSLALVVALAVDPDAETGEIPGGEPATEPETEPPADPAAPEQPAGAKSDSPPTAHIEANRDRVAASPAPSRTSVAWELGVLAFLQTGVAPEPLTGAGVGARSTISRLGPLGEPSVALQILAADSQIAGPDTGPASYRWIVARALVCPTSASPASRFSARPCVVADLGAVSGSGEAIAYRRTSTGLWSSLGAAGEAAWQPVDPVILTLSASFGANLSRHRFVFERPRLIVHEVPALGFGAAFGAGARF